MSSESKSSLSDKIEELQNGQTTMFNLKVQSRVQKVASQINSFSEFKDEAAAVLIKAGAYVTGAKTKLSFRGQNIPSPLDQLLHVAGELHIGLHATFLATMWERYLLRMRSSCHP